MKKVGMLLHVLPNNSDGTLISNAYESTFMRPKTTTPYYEYVDSSGRLISSSDFRLDTMFKIEMDAYDHQMTAWRVTRRNWEKELVFSLHGDKKKLPFLYNVLDEHMATRDIYVE